MRLGLIARADNSGLGVQSHEFYRHMQPAKTLVIDVGHLYDGGKHANKQTFRDRYPDAEFFPGWTPDPRTLQGFLDGLDVVFSAETFYSTDLPAMASQAGVRTVLQPNWEFIDKRYRPDLYAAPTLWHFDKIPGNKNHLPVPIATDRFVPTDFPTAGPLRFLHVIGRPAVHDRNGTQDLLDSLRYVRAEVTVSIRCQDTAYAGELLGRHSLPPNVTLDVSGGDTQDYWDNYAGHDVLLMPRRFGGLCLPAQEAVGAGMPVIMPNISPNEWLPAEWLVEAGWCDSFRAMQRVDIYSANHHALAAKIDQFATDAVFLKQARTDALRLRDEMSWAALKPKYLEVLR